MTVACIATTIDLVMTRPFRIEFPGAFYHLTARGNSQKEIYLCDGDRTKFLSILGSVVDKRNWICHAYCLMSNHYHLLIETPKPNLSSGMLMLNTRYAKYFNWRHNKSGHLFQGRFHSVIVERDSYLLELCRYIVLNPVRAGLVDYPKNWKWSSFLATAGKVPKPRFLNVRFILEQFHEASTGATDEYVSFVMQGIGMEVWKDLRGGVVIGSDQFTERISKQLGSNILKQAPFYKRNSKKISLEEVFNSGESSRDEKIYHAYFLQGYRLREIGEFLGITPSRVSQILRGQVGMETSNHA